MANAAEPPKVFLSYRSADRPVVEEFAARLRQDGVDAWYDHWEIVPGDDIVAKMDQGIDGCAAGLIFVSNAWFELAHRSAADYEAIRDTLLGIDRKPGVATAMRAHTRAVTIRLEDTGAGDRASVSLLVDGRLSAHEPDVRVLGALRLRELGPAAFAGLRQRVRSVLLPARSAGSPSDCWPSSTLSPWPTCASRPHQRWRHCPSRRR